MNRALDVAQRFVRFVAVGLTILALAPAASGEEESPLTNQDVIAMTEAGLPEETILMSVQTSSADFSTGAQDLIALQKAGVSTAVMKAMLARDSAPNGALPGVAGAPAVIVVPTSRPAMPQIAQQPIIIDGESRIGLKRTAHDYKYDFDKATMIGESTDETHVVIRGEQSDLRLSSGALAVEVPLEGVTARPEQQMFLLRLDAKRGTRQALTQKKVESETLHGTSLLGGGVAGYAATAVAANVVAGVFRAAKAKATKNKGPVVPMQFSEVSDLGVGGLKIFHATPKEPLEAGEYAVLWNGDYWDFGVD